MEEIAVIVGSQTAGIRKKLGKAKINMNRTRYLDVMTVSASHGSTLSKDSHQQLFVEPVLLPNMSHLKVDKATEAADSCLFYPSGEKSVQMKSAIDNAVRNINSEVAIEEAIRAREAKGKLKTIRESIVVPNRATSSSGGKGSRSGLGSSAGGRKSRSALSTKSISPGRQVVTTSPADAADSAAVGATGASSSKSYNINSNSKYEPLFQGKQTSKEMKDLFKKIRVNESKIVSTVKSRF